MKQIGIRNLLKKILNTQEQEISCSECFDSVSHYVELEIMGEDAARGLPLVKQHLEQCAACRDEYETLHDLRRLEEAGSLPPLEDLLA